MALVEPWANWAVRRCVAEGRQQPGRPDRARGFAAASPGVRSGRRRGGRLRMAQGGGRGAVASRRLDLSDTPRCERADQRAPLRSLDTETAVTRRSRPPQRCRQHRIPIPSETTSSATRMPQAPQRLGAEGRERALCRARRGIDRGLWPHMRRTRAFRNTRRIEAGGAGASELDRILASIYMPRWLLACPCLSPSVPVSV